MLVPNCQIENTVILKDRPFQGLQKADRLGSPLIALLHLPTVYQLKVSLLLTEVALEMRTPNSSLALRGTSLGLTMYKATCKVAGAARCCRIWYNVR